MDFGKSAILERDKDADSDVDLDLSTAHLAAASGETEKLIKAIKVDPTVLELQDGDGLTPLGHAVTAQHLGSVKRLVKMGSNINAQDKLGRSGLAMAAYQGWYEGLVYLLRHGAKLQVCDRSGRSPLHAATYHTDVRTLCALLHSLSSGELNQRDHEGMTALHWSAFHNRPDHVRILLERGADIFREDVDGKTALHWAAQNGSLECCKLIYKWTAGTSLVNSMDHADKTPVHFAAAAGHTEVIQEFAKIDDCDLEAEDLDDRTPLHWAAAMGQKDCVSLFLDLGVPPNPIDAEGSTPLDYAKQTNHSDCQQILEEKVGMSSKSSQGDRSVALSASTSAALTSSKTPFGFIKGLFGIKTVKPAQISNESSSNITDSDMETVNMSSVEDEKSTDNASTSMATKDTAQRVDSNASQTDTDSVESDLKLEHRNTKIRGTVKPDDMNAAVLEMKSVERSHEIREIQNAVHAVGNEGMAGKCNSVGGDVERMSDIKVDPVMVQGEQLMISQPKTDTVKSSKRMVISPRILPLASQKSALDIPRTPPRSQLAPPPSPRQSPLPVAELSELAPLRGPIPITGASMHEKVAALRMERTGPSRSPTPPNWIDRSFDPLSPRQQPGLSPLVRTSEDLQRKHSYPSHNLRQRRSPGTTLSSGSDDQDNILYSHTSGLSNDEVLDYVAGQNSCTSESPSRGHTPSLSSALSPQVSPSPSLRSDVHRSRIGEKPVKFSTRERKQLDRQLHNLLL